uniref:Uncharacterized protein n=1 Tax=uncultured marine virus TaxID=186617 RepID=A0A0F7LAU8_9VIRU|nr:hypothetical protein [uncultured marine virus]
MTLLIQKQQTEELHLHQTYSLEQTVMKLQCTQTMKPKLQEQQVTNSNLLEL